MTRTYLLSPNGTKNSAQNHRERNLCCTKTLLRLWQTSYECSCVHTSSITRALIWTDLLICVRVYVTRACTTYEYTCKRRLQEKTLRLLMSTVYHCCSTVAGCRLGRSGDGCEVTDSCCCHSRQQQTCEVGEMTTQSLTYSYYNVACCGNAQWPDLQKKS